MPHLLGLELHTPGYSVAAMDAGLTIGSLALADHDGALAHTSARAWKWSLGTDDGDLVASVTAGQFFAGVEESAGAGSLAVVAIPSAWGDRPRRSLLHALERTTLDVLRLARETSALVVGASLADPSLSGVCAVVDLGGHKLEVALAEVTGGMLRVLARESVVGLGDERMGFGEVLQLITGLGRRLTDEAGLEPRDVERVIAGGRRLALPSMAHGVESIWAVPPELAAPGAIARGAARLAAGLAGALPAWIIDDDLHEAPLAHLRPSARRGVSTIPPAPSPLAHPSSEHPSSGRPSDVGISEHPSVMPGAGPAAPVPSSGDFVGLASVDAARALDLVHPVSGGGLAHPALITLLNQFTFLRGASGTLTLRSRDDVLALPIYRGGVCVSAGERARALRVGEWSAGTFTWREEPLSSALTKLRTPMTAFVVGALRARLRAFGERDFDDAYLPKMDLSPSVHPDRFERLERLCIPEAELRAVEHVVDGSRSLQTMLGEGYIGRMTLLRLVLLLDLYSVLQWAAPTHAAVEDPVAAMARTLTAMERGNHFVALGVHWSAGPEEIHEAWERLRAEYAPDGRWAPHDPAAAAAIVRRGEAAWQVLRDDGARVQHRRESYEGMDEALLAPLVEARAKALEMRGENRAAAEMSRLQKEFAAVLPRRERK
ncbi:MAG: Hsp70 family protein [Deltaproteobacteria bacterium]|nr:Hsp70 family protein [Myxococcales bacterium]MDP3214775.1 Hsp70 family protein [Deltaproteobacteria bacterium]